MTKFLLSTFLPVFFCCLFMQQSYSQTIRLEVDPYRAAANEVNRTNDCLRQNNNNWYGNVCNVPDDGDDPENTSCDDCVIGGSEDIDVVGMLEAGGNYTGAHIINDQTCGWHTWGSGWGTGDPQNTYTWYVQKTETIRGRISGAEDDSGFCSGDFSGSNDGECGPSPYGLTWGSLPNSYDTYNANTGSWFRDNGSGLDLDASYCPYAWTGYHQNTIENCMLENGTNDYRTQWRYRWVFGNSAGNLVGMTNSITTGNITACTPYDRSTINSTGYTNCQVNFQWQLSTNGGGYVNIGGATAATYNPPNLTVPGTYDYRRRIAYRNSFAGGIAYTYSNVVRTSIVADPTISSGGGTTICSGGSVTLTSATSGGISCSYQWQTWNGSTYVNIGGATGSTYTTPALFSTSYYRVQRICSGTSCGTATSLVQTVTVLADPAISASGTQTVCVGGAAPLSYTDSGGSGCTNHWQRWNGVSWVDVGSSAANYTPVVTATTQYRVQRRCTGTGCNTATSNIVTVTAVSDPTISASGATTVCSGGTATLTSSSSGGAGSCSFQWQRWNGSTYVNIGGATGSTYTTPALTSTEIYRVQRICTGNGCGTATSNTQTVTVVNDPSIVTVTPSPNNANVCVGQTLTVTSPTYSGGTGACSVEYRYSTNGGTTYTGWSTTVPSFAATGTDNRIQTRVVCSGSGCNIPAATTTYWTVSPAPTITSSGGGNICDGGSILLSSSASGGSGCTYQWQSSTTSGAGPFVSIGGATSATYSASPSIRTYYRVLLICSGSGCTNAISNVQSVTPVPQPTVSANGSTSFCGSGSATLTSSVSGGTGTCTYQWYSSSDNVSFTPIGGATSSSYTTPTIATTTYYRVQRMCTGTGCNTATSNSLTVAVTGNSSSAFTDTICANEMYTLPSGAMVMGAGVYPDVIPNAAGCDSNITVTLITPPSATHFGLYAASTTDYYQLNPLTGAVLNTYPVAGNSLGWTNGAFTMHEQNAEIYWITDGLNLSSLDLTSGTVSGTGAAVGAMSFFWGLRYYDGYLYTITTSADNDKMLVRMNPSTGTLDAGFTAIEINGSAGYDILVHSSPVINPITGIFYIPLYGNVMLAFDIGAGTGNIVTLSGYVTAGGFIGLLEINENTGEMYALSGFSDLVEITPTGPSTATVSLVKTITSGSGFSNPISAFDSDNELYIFQGQSGCSINNPLITIDVNSGTEWCSNPPGLALNQMEYLNCKPASTLREDPTAFDVNVYPNPVKDVLKFALDLVEENDIVVQVYSISGAFQLERQYQGLKGQNLVELNVSELTNGIHIVRVVSGKNQFTTKIIKL